MGLDAVVATSPTPSWKLRLLTPLHIVGRIVDLLALAACAFVSFILLRRGEWTPARIAAIAMLLLFVAQGLIASRPLQHRAVSLSGGDDWLQYEALSRAVATGDVLMLFGRPPGQGLVLYYYPGYIYFVAAMHAVGGEDLSTVIFVQFLLLWAANVVVYRIGSRLFDPRVALAAVAALVVIEEMAFMRYYTVTLLSENLYFFTVAMTLYAFVRFVESGRRGALVACAIGAGVSALTRPAMLLYLIPAAFVVCVASFRHRRSIAAAAAAAAMFVAIWLATVSPATIRNYIAAGSPVLICDPPVAGFINYNLPPNVDAKQYPARFSSTTLSVAAILVDIAVHYPMDTLRSVTTKVGFSLGLVQWMGGKWHPELLLASAGYVIAVLLIPSARAAATWPIHAFVIAHLAGMVITMPSNYGYRLILPMYLFFPLFAARAASELASRFVR
jgi:4-amino-4-deoxy-L-arabinose transferase-like glycosyltransferase